MTVQELIAKLALLPQNDTVKIRVDCPHGGNSLPADIFAVYHIEPTFTGGKDISVIVCDPEEGVEFEVQDADDSDEGDIVLDEPFSPEPQWGQCGKCGDWVTFPCCNCQARELEKGN